MNNVKAKYCFYCEREYGLLANGKILLKTKDHILPKSRGGTNQKLNIIYCCNICNNKKADKTIQEFHDFLITRLENAKIQKTTRPILETMVRNLKKLIEFTSKSPIRKPKQSGRWQSIRLPEDKKRPSTPLWWRGLNEK